jgi:putative nucleotidyltransferase with HDIG domain
MDRKAVLKEINSGKSYRINLPCIIGRSQDADLSFSDPAVSHHHALIKDSSGEIWVEDLGSRNGVFVNGKRISGSTLLKTGDMIEFGQRKMVLHLEDEVDIDQTTVLYSIAAEAEWIPERPRLRLIQDIAGELTLHQDLPALGAKILGRLGEVFKQDRGYLALLQEDGSLEVLSSAPSSLDIPISRSITGRLLQSGESLLLEDALSDTALKEQESIIAMKIRSALCAPLRYHDRTYGVLYVDRNMPSAFTREDLELLRSVASIIAPLIENANLFHELKHAFHETVKALADTIEKRDTYTGGHTQRVMNYSMAIGTMMGLADETLEILKLAAILHDIGKIGVRDNILLKEGYLNSEEAVIMMRHTEFGSEILGHVTQLREVIQGVRSHHEKYDGTGYPDGLKGENIPLIARIIAVADTFDAMTTDRPYRKSLTFQAAFEELRKNVGIQFDGEVVEKFIHHFKMTSIL